MKTQDQAIITALLSHVTSECTRIDVDDRYDEMLDECYSFGSVGGPFAYMSASMVLREVNPTAYRCGKNDYVDGEEWVEIDGDYYDKREVDEAVESFADDLDSELTDLETDLEEAKEDEEADQNTVKELEGKIAAKQAEIEAVRAYSF